MNCEICGGPLRPGNRINICSRTRECKNAKQQAYRQAVKDAEVKRTCELCGSPLRKTNTTGICTQNPDCKNSSKRRRRLNGKSDDGTLNFCDLCGTALQTTNTVGVCQTNRECRNENASRHFKRQHHEDLTYLMFSPGLNTHKIGHTTNLNHRMTGLRNGCWDIEVITTFPYGRDLESWLHARFAATRIAGTEWFHDITEVDVKNAVAEYELI